MANSPLEQLVQSFIKFPGIGPRQARRFVYYLLHANGQTITNLVHQINDLRRQAAQCPECYRYFLGQPAGGDCDLCLDAGRDRTLLMIVEKDIDLENIHKSGTYNGQYFVLGGLAPILDEEPEKTIRLKQLMARIKKAPPQEIIIALAVNPEGDYTIEILRQALTSLSLDSTFKISVLGRGLSSGSELEYSDPDTLKNAINNRH